MCPVENTEHSLLLLSTNQRDKEKCEMLQRNKWIIKDHMINVNQSPCKKKKNETKVYCSTETLSTYFHEYWRVRFPSTF